jgi:ATP-dependent protease Clp ATPase subunit
MERKVAADNPRCCSFCGKHQGAVGKLISSPSTPRAFICDQCITVCASVIDDARVASQGGSSSDLEFVWRHPFLEHPLVSQLLEAVESWVHEESIGNQESAALSRMRTLAKQMAQDVSGKTNKLA